MNTTSTSFEYVHDTSLDYRLPDKRTAVRPVEPVSSYVAEVMPDDIAAVRAGSLSVSAFEDNAERLAEQVAAPDAPTRTESVIALADAAMLESAILGLGGRVRSKSYALTDRMADRIGESASLTYEGIIGRNPLTHDPRLFTQGATGEKELLFYAAHKQIERHLSASITAVRSALAQQDPGIVSDLLRGVVTRGIESVRGEFATLRNELDAESFDAIRPLFGEQTQRNIPGPSGNYSAGMVTLDDLLIGDREDVRTYNGHKMMQRSLYPGSTVADDAFAGREDMRMAEASATQGRTINVAASTSPEVRKAASEVFALMAEVRRMHVSSAAKHIADVLKDDNVKGTGGQSHLRRYLTMPIDMYSDASSLLQS